MKRTNELQQSFESPFETDVSPHAADDRELEKLFKELSDVKYALDQSAIVAITDQRGAIQYVNEQFCQISKYTKEELLGVDHRILNSGRHPREFFKELWATIGSGKIWRGEIRNRAKDDSYYWVYTTIVPFLNEKGRPYQYVSIRHDITEKKKMEEEIQRSKEEKFRLITENSSDLVAIVDAEKRFVYAAPSFGHVLGYTLSSLEGKDMPGFVNAADQATVAAELDAILTGRRDASHMEFKIMAADGSMLDVDMNANPVLNQDGTVEKIVVAMRDIREKKKSEQLLRHLANHDALTGLPNRRVLIHELKRLLKQPASQSSRFAVMYLDLDRFKHINDTWGHETGDGVLIEATRRISAAAGSGNTVCRLGGDEFTVLLQDIELEQKIQYIAVDILERFHRPFELDGKLHDISTSIGIAIFPEDGKDADTLLTRADHALYAAKELGRNQYAFFHKIMEEKSLERLLIENEMRKALSLNQFSLTYQPRVDLETERLIGMEVRAAWQHPELGSIDPDQFIPLAVETGLILPLGDWMLKEGCRQSMAWQNNGLPPLRMIINVSAKQLNQARFLERLKQTLQETGMRPEMLELEMSLPVFEQLDHSGYILQGLKDAGILLSVSGFCAEDGLFSYILRTPVDEVKIDASFLSDLGENQHTRSIVSAIATIAQTLGVEVVADGVKNRGQLEIRKGDGCRKAQGAYFGDPLSQEEFEHYLEKRAFERT